MKTFTTVTLSLMIMLISFDSMAARGPRKVRDRVKSEVTGEPPAQQAPTKCYYQTYQTVDLGTKPVPFCKENDYAVHVYKVSGNQADFRYDLVAAYKKNVVNYTSNTSREIANYSCLVTATTGNAPAAHFIGATIELQQLVCRE